MGKSYHEHRMQEKEEAEAALSNAKEKEQNNVRIHCRLSASRRMVVAVPRRRLLRTIAKLKAKGYVIEDQEDGFVGSD